MRCSFSCGSAVIDDPELRKIMAADNHLVERCIVIDSVHVQPVGALGTEVIGEVEIDEFRVCRPPLHN
jgi:hypothetical protein